MRARHTLSPHPRPPTAHRAPPDRLSRQVGTSPDGARTQLSKPSAEMLDAMDGNVVFDPKLDLKRE